MEIDPTASMQDMMEGAGQDEGLRNQMQEIAFAIPGVDEAMSFAE